MLLQQDVLLNLGIYQVREVLEDKIKAVKIDSSYGNYHNYLMEVTSCENTGKVKVQRKYAKWAKDSSGFVEPTAQEKFKVDNKTFHVVYARTNLYFR